MGDYENIRRLLRQSLFCFINPVGGPVQIRTVQERPEEVNHVIVNKDGSMVCHVPVSFIKVSPPRKVSDKQRETARERFVKMWAEKQESGFAEEIPEDLMEEFLEEEI